MEGSSGGPEATRGMWWRVLRVMPEAPSLVEDKEDRGRRPSDGLGERRGGESSVLLLMGEVNMVAIEGNEEASVEEDDDTTTDNGDLVSEWSEIG